MLQMPEAFVGGHKPLDVATPVAVGVDWAPHQHEFEKVQQALSDFEVRSVTSMMEGDQELIRQPAGVSQRLVGRGLMRDFVRHRDHVVRFLLKRSFHASHPGVGCNYKTMIVKTGRQAT